MKKILLGSVAIVGLAALSSPAMAAEDGGVKLDLGGYFKGYMSWLDQDTTPDDPATAGADESVDVRNFEMVRDTEIHFTGESTLDNGLTVGFHAEADADDEDTFDVDESYGYFSGAWGRANLGSEDGAAYLLQVAAPSADSNIDGLRQYVQAVNYDEVIAAGTAADSNIDDLFNAGLATNDILVDVGAVGTSVDDVRLGANLTGTSANFRFDYDQAISGSNDKITYLTPVFNGFQFGASFTPNLDANSIDQPAADGHTRDDNVGDYGNAWEIAARYEGQWDQLGITLGAGWAHNELEADDTDPAIYRDENGSGTYTAAADTVIATLDDREAWNAGIDLNWGAFGLGGGYMEDDNGVSDEELQSETWVLGVDYTTGPFKIGGSYYDQTQNFGGAEFETSRWTGGVVYTYGPGMTFRGSISFLDLEEDIGSDAVSDDAEATSVLLGTQINF